MIGGRPVPELLGGVIRNDGGDTVLAVNGVSLYESANGGRLSAWAPNGARDVALAEGFTGLDFTSHEDFVYRSAPRAAVYEALPGFLLRLDAPGLSEERAASPGSPVWARISGGRGTYEPERSTTGAEYDFSRFAAEAGLDFSLEEGVTGSVSVFRIQGSADVNSPVGGGKMETEGFGAALGISLSWRKDFYAQGRFSLSNYSVDISSSDLGRLDSGVGARANSLNFEAGRNFALNEKVRLTPRAWLARSAVETDGFTDAVNSRVSSGDSSRLVGGLGVVAETARERNWRGGALSLRGSLDLAQTLGDTHTSVDVSGEKLESKSPKTRLLLGLGGKYRKGRFSVGAEVSAGGLRFGRFGILGPGHLRLEVPGRVGRIDFGELMKHSAQHAKPCFPILSRLLIFLCALVWLAGCGGGGGSTLRPLAALIPEIPSQESQPPDRQPDTPEQPEQPPASPSTGCIALHDGTCASIPEFNERASQLAQGYADHPTFKNQWGLGSIGADRAYAHVNLLEGENAAPGAGVTIGFIDTGIDHDHPIFAGKTITEVFMGGAVDETGVDDFSHGTAVASIAAGIRDHSSPGRHQGVAWGADIAMFAIPLGEGDGTYTPISLEGLAGADAGTAQEFNQVLSWRDGGRRVEVLNLSFGAQGVIDGYSEADLRANFSQAIARTRR